jgi:hypothetical protein
MIISNSPSMDNPGAPGKGRGPTWSSAGANDSLLLPSGKTIAETPDPELRTALDALGIEGAHRDGRNIIVQRYADLIANFRQKAGDAAITAYLAANK